ITLAHHAVQKVPTIWEKRRPSHGYFAAVGVGGYNECYWSTARGYPIEAPAQIGRKDNHVMTIPCPSLRGDVRYRLGRATRYVDFLQLAILRVGDEPAIG